VATRTVFAIVIVAVALVFDVANGWHDAANSIATVVSTRVLSPGVAVIWAAFFNFARPVFLYELIRRSLEFVGKRFLVILRLRAAALRLDKPSG
jgi:hypothetical protein